MKARKNGVSVIVCCYNSAQRLEPTLRHLFRQKVASTIEWEIIVVNNNSSDNTVQKATDLYSESDESIAFRVVDELNPGLSNARNKGFQSAKYDYALMVDDDNWLSENYVETVYNDLTNNENVAMVGGLGIPGLEGKEPTWFKQYASCYATGTQSNSGSGPLRSADELYGAGCALKLSALDNIQQLGFSNILSDRTTNSLMSGGDTELCYAFRLAGYDLLYDERISFSHLLPEQRVNWQYLKNLFHGFGMTKTLIDIYISAINGNLVPAENQRFPYWFNRVWFLFTDILKDSGILIIGAISQAEGNHKLLSTLAKMGQLKSTFLYRHQLIPFHQQVQAFKTNAQKSQLAAADDLQKPLVTVLMPVYNAEKYLAEAIESILNQTFTNFEFLIINDGSTDGSVEIIRSYKDERIRYVENQENLRLIATLNKGIDLANGEYIARMDADDVSETNRLQTQVEFMDANPEIGVCGSWFKSIGSESNSMVKYPVDDFNIRYTALYQCPFCHPTVFIRASILKQHDIKYSSMYPHAEDYELWLRLARVTHLANIPEFLLQYRQHDQSVSKIEFETQDRLSQNIRRQFFLETGVQTTDLELSLFRRFNYRDNTFSIEHLKALGKLISRLLSSSKSEKYFNRSDLEPLLAEKWFHLCTNHARYGIEVWKLFKQLEISTERISKIDLIKFKLKTWIKK